MLESDLSNGKFFAVPGYDLCTGWGSPGTNLINLFVSPIAGADLILTATNGPLPAAVGVPLTIGLSISNAGPLAVTNAILTNLFSPPVTILSVSSSQGTLSNSPTSVVCRLGNLASNGFAQVLIRISPTAIGFLTNNASVSSEAPDPAAGNNSVSTVVAVSPADLGIGISSPNPTTYTGYPAAFTISVTNLGSSPATSVTVKDILPAGTIVGAVTVSQGTYTNDGTTVTFNTGNLALNAVATFTLLQTLPTAIGDYTNVVSVSANEPDPDSSNNQASIVTTVVALPPMITGVQAQAFPSAAFITWQTFSNATTQVAYGLSTSYGAISTLDSTLRTNHAVFLSGLVPDATYYFEVVSVVDGLIYTETGSFSTVATIILDNPDASYSGFWAASAVGSRYGSYCQLAYTTADPFSPDATAAYVPNMPVAGKYDVSIWYPQNTQYSANAQVLIQGAGDPIFASVDQTGGGGQWRTLATQVDFAAGSDGSVTIMNNTGEPDKLVAADAVRFIYSAGQDNPMNNGVGTPPGWWSQFYFGTNSVSGTADADGDGYSNYTEYILGTSPNDGASQLNFNLQKSGNGATLSFSPYQGGRIYNLQFKATINGTWSTLLLSPAVGANGEGVFNLAQTQGAGFYRLTARVAP